MVSFSIFVASRASLIDCRADIRDVICISNVPVLTPPKAVFGILIICPTVNVGVPISITLVITADPFITLISNLPPLLIVGVYVPSFPNKLFPAYIANPAKWIVSILLEFSLVKSFS